MDEVLRRDARGDGDAARGRARGGRNVRGGIPRGRQRRSVHEVVADDAGVPRSRRGVDADGAPGGGAASRAVRDEDAGRGEDAGYGRGAHGRDVGGAVSERVRLSIVTKRGKGGRAGWDSVLFAVSVFTRS